MPEIIAESATVILLISSLLVTFGSQIYLSAVSKKASKIQSTSGLTGAETARKILEYHQLDKTVKIIKVQGHLSDYYDSRNKELALSDTVHDKTSIMAIAVAAHEVGHAIQDKEKYRFLVLRHMAYPITSFSSWLAPILILAGMIFSSWSALFGIGLILFSVTVVFTIITLPVEFDASRRALATIQQIGIVPPTEMPQARKVLKAAALTYVAATVTAIFELIRLYLLYKDND